MSLLFITFLRQNKTRKTLTNSLPPQESRLKPKREVKAERPSANNKTARSMVALEKAVDDSNSSPGGSKQNKLSPKAYLLPKGPGRQQKSLSLSISEL